MAIIGLLAVAVLMAVKNENVIYEDIYKASVTTKITSVRDGLPSFRQFCRLSCVVLFCCERLSQPVSSHLYGFLF